MTQDASKEDEHAKAEESAAASDILERLEPGALVAGKFRVERTLGRGAMGLVVAAHHVALRERVALKFLRVDRAHESFRSRFAREARLCARIKSPHVVRVLDVGSWGPSAIYMVMEYLEGIDLRKRLSEGGPLPIDQAVGYALQICEGLAAVHARGIVHRDLKPANLLITTSPDGAELLKILDFGISKSEASEGDEDESLTKAGDVLGTPSYMAPEQLFGTHDVGPAADVWSLGAICYAMLTGRTPYDATTLPKLCTALSRGAPPPPPSALRPGVSPELDAVVMRCLERELARRYHAVADVAGDLLRAIESPWAESERARLEAALVSSLPRTDSVEIAAVRAHRSTVTGAAVAGPALERPAVASRRSIGVMAVLAAVGGLLLLRPITARNPSAAAPDQAAAPLDVTSRVAGATSEVAAPATAPPKPVAPSVAPVTAAPAKVHPAHAQPTIAKTPPSSPPAPAPPPASAAPEPMLTAASPLDPLGDRQ